MIELRSFKITYQTNISVFLLEQSNALAETWKRF